jgi:uncharacterized protein (DUF3820 family)
MIMPFGRYEGEEISSIDSSYLAWVIKDCKDISEELWEAITEELDERYNNLETDRNRRRY